MLPKVYDNRIEKSSPSELARRRAEYFGPDLKDSVPLNPVCRLKPDLRSSLVAEFASHLRHPAYPPPIDQRRHSYRAAGERNLECLIANLIRIMDEGLDCLAFHQNKAAYRGTPLTEGIIRQVKLAEACGILHKVDGYHDKLHRQNSVVARIWLTEQGRQLLAPYQGRAAAITDYPPVVKREERKVPGTNGTQTVDVPPEEWNLTVRERHIVKVTEFNVLAFNTFAAAFHIEYTDEAGRIRPIDPNLHAVFNGDFAHGGRLFCGLNGHQTLSKAERSTITIDGKPTIELDYGGLHIRMLYHLAGTDYPMDGDPYSDVLHMLGLQNAPGIRGDLKEMLLALINDHASDKLAIARAKRRLFPPDNPTAGPAARQEKCEERHAREKAWAEAGLVRDGQPDVARVLEAFRKAHAPIQQFFNSGIGLKLQNLDGIMARGVLSLMMWFDKCVLTLPVHDSFIAVADSETRLRQAMTGVYQTVMQIETGQSRAFLIPVEKKPKTPIKVDLP